MACSMWSPGGGSKKVSSWGILCHGASPIFDAKWRGAPLEFHLTPYKKFGHDATSDQGREFVELRGYPSVPKTKTRKVLEAHSL